MIDRAEVRAALIQRKYEVVDLDMQTQARYAGILLGGANTKHGYILDPVVKNAGVEDELVALGFVKTPHGPRRYWWKTTDLNKLYAGLNLVRNNLN